jgi:S1-C subfamily serine protease
MNRALVAGLALAGLALTLAPLRAQAPPQPARAPRVFLGVMAEATPAGATESGMLVRGVTPDSPADKAGLKPGDVIVKVGDKSVKEPEDLVAAMADRKPGDKVTFRVRRNNKDQDISVTLGERPTRRPGGPGGQPRERAGGFLGVQTQPLTAEARQRLGVTADHGVVVTDVLANSPADRAGLKTGDVITGAAGHDVTDAAGLREAISTAGAAKELTLNVLRGKEKKEVKARLEEPPVDGLTFPMPPFPRPGGPGVRPGGPSLFEAAEKVQELERRVADLEKRVRDLEQKRQPK